MGVTRAEQETIIRWDEDEQVVRIRSASPKTWRRAAKLGLCVIRTETRGRKVEAMSYLIPAKDFRWSVVKVQGPRPQNRNLEHLRKAREVQAAARRANGREDAP